MSSQLETSLANLGKAMAKDAAPKLRKSKRAPTRERKKIVSKFREMFPQKIPSLYTKKAMRGLATHDNSPQCIAGFCIGQRVQTHPATDSWMRGDRYGDVVGFKRGGGAIKVHLDVSGRTKAFDPNNLLHVE